MEASKKARFLEWMSQFTGPTPQPQHGGRLGRKETSMLTRSLTIFVSMGQRAIHQQWRSSPTINECLPQWLCHSGYLPPILRRTELRGVVGCPSSERPVVDDDVESTSTVSTARRMYIRWFRRRGRYALREQGGTPDSKLNLSIHLHFIHSFVPPTQMSKAKGLTNNEGGEYIAGLDALMWLRLRRRATWVSKANVGGWGLRSKLGTHSLSPATARDSRS